MIIIVDVNVIINIIIAIIITIIICIQEDVGCRRHHLTSGRAGEPRAVVSLGDLSDASLGSFLVTMLQCYNITQTLC